MRKPKRRDIVSSILRLIETKRPSKKLYGYFTRRQLVELHTYLLVRNDDSKEIFTNASTLRKRLDTHKQLTGETNMLLRNIMRLTTRKGD